MSPVLPKRAETFAGFDNSGREMSDKVSVLKRKLMQLKEMEGDGHGDKELSCSDSSLHIKPKSEGNSNIKFISNLKSPEMVSSASVPNNSPSQDGYCRIQQVAELNQLLVNVTSLLHHHLSVCRKEHGRRRYRPDHQLEELRNIQEKLSQERLQWEQEKAKQEKELEKKKAELLLLQKRLSADESTLESNKLSCHPTSCDHNCSSLSLCKHRRSASFDFRALGTLTQDVGGRQSWSGPIADSWHQQFCSTQSTSDIPNHQEPSSKLAENHLFINSSDSEGTITRRVSACDAIPKGKRLSPEAYGKCLCPTVQMHVNNGHGKNFCGCRDSL